MRVRVIRTGLSFTASLAALALAGCGGGGGARVEPTPPPPSVAPAPTPTATPPPPPPAPTPAPPPPATNFNDAEYQRSNGAWSNGAIHAYNAGGTGQGVKIAVVDSGINPNLAEFAGKIDPASRDMVASRGVSDTEGHGTAVSAVAAAARNGSGMMGVAFDSTIISLNTSNPNNCDDKGCKHSDSAIAQSIDVARTNGARVINISLGGDGGVGSAVLSAVNRATLSGIVVVMSAGNKSEPNPGSFAAQTAQTAGNGLVIIAGAHDANRQLAGFSNQAGTAAAHYLTAIGDRVRAFNHNGEAFLYSGTSFAAPVISGAAALLASAFPHLTGGQIVQLLLSTADDAGAPGRDSVFGNGILNIQRAFGPQGQTTMAGSAVPVSAVTGQTSGAMGDAGGEMIGAVILDGFSRAYVIDIARTLARAPQQRPLAQGLQPGIRTAQAQAGATSVSITMARNLTGRAHIGLAHSGLSHDDARQARAIAGHALTRLGKETAAAFGFAESGRALQQRLIGAEGNAFLVASDPLSRAGFQPDAGHSIGLRHDLGLVGLTVTSERGAVHAPERAPRTGEAGYTIGTIAADRRFGRLALTLGASRLAEEATLLGGRFDFAGGGATSWFLDAAAGYDLGRGWRAAGSYRHGWTAIPGAAGLVEGGRLASDAFSVDLSKRGAFAASDRLALRVMQPLRVRSGGLDMNLPVAFSYEDFSVGYERRRMSLAPTGREIDFEAAYGLGLLRGAGGLTVNAFLRRDPGHIEAMPDDVGAALRFTLGF